MTEWQWKAQYIRYVPIRIYRFTFICRDLIQSCRCLAHVINLATQALLATYSKAKYYEPGMFDIDNDFGIPGADGIWRDEIGLIRAISVKVGLLITLQV